jgi:aspartate/methionine/tyrosine aminotransferase
MKLEPFELERWLLNPCSYDLAGGGIIKLQLGDLINTIDFNMTMSYGVTNGSNLIRSEIATLYDGISDDNILLTTGTSEANFLALYYLLEKGDEFVAFIPSYMQCIGIARSFGSEVKLCKLREFNDYQIDLDTLKKMVTKKQR